MYNLIKFSMISTIIITFVTGCTIYTPLDDDEVDNNHHSVSSTFAYNIQPDGQKKLSLEGINGSVHIVGTDDTMIRIEGERIVGSDSEEDADRHLDYLRVEIHEYRDVIEVQTIQPASSEGRDYRVNYEIHIPHDWNVCFVLANGNATLDSLSGDICGEIVNGEFILHEDRGNIAVGATNGNILADIQIPFEGYCEMAVVNGNINLTIPKETDAELHASVVNGIISVGNLTMNYLSQSRSEVRGTMGTGDASIDLVTVNGTIMVRGK